MVKILEQRYLGNGVHLSLNELYSLATPHASKKGLLPSIDTSQANGVPVKLAFVRNRYKKSDGLAILSTSTDCTLSEQETIRIYSMKRTHRTVLAKPMQYGSKNTRRYVF